LLVLNLVLLVGLVVGLVVGLEQYFLFFSLSSTRT